MCIHQKGEIQLCSTIEFKKQRPKFMKFEGIVILTIFIYMTILFYGFTSILNKTNSSLFSLSIMDVLVYKNKILSTLTIYDLSYFFLNDFIQNSQYSIMATISPYLF